MAITSAPDDQATLDPSGTGLHLPVATIAGQVVTYDANGNPILPATAGQLAATGQFVDLGNGQVAPTANSTGTGMVVLPPIIPSDYSPFGLHLGDVTSLGKILSWDMWGHPVYDSSITNTDNVDPFAPFNPAPGELEKNGLNAFPVDTGGAIGTDGGSDIAIQQTPNGTNTTSGTGLGTSGPSAGSAGTTSVSDGGTAVNRLIDLAAMMYASAGVKGGGTGFGGLVTSPVATSVTGESSQSAPKSQRGIILIGVLAVAALGYWYYKKHKG